jgi:ABC-type lipoprotein export system ATPase subunit
MNPLLKLDNVAKTFQTSRMVVAALNDVSIRIEPGEFVAVMGPSGSGKSTLLLACGTLLSPDAGTITIQNINPYALPPNNRSAFRAAHIGFVFQQFHLIPYLNARDNIRTAASGMPSKSATRRTDELLERFGLAGRARHYPSELSVGERQRVGLARAMLNSPPLLLADEPTGNLDETSGMVVLNALSDYTRQNAAVLMVTHDPRAAALATRNIKMNLGRLV